MRVIIIGCGKLGYRIAETFSNANYNVIVIDREKEIVNKVNEALDVMAIRYNGFVGKSLKEIDVNEKDLVIAVTGSDEGNILACIAAKEAGAGKTIARIRNPEYSKDLSVSKEKLSIDHIVNPEKATADEVSRLLAVSPAGQTGDFVMGKVQMIEIPIEDTNPFINKRIMDIDTGNFLVAAISRNSRIIIPKGTNMIMAGDTIYVIGIKEDVLNLCKSMGKKWRKVRSAMILGGGKISYYLAENLLQHGASVKIIERDKKRCEELAEVLPNALIINGDGSDIDLLQSENISSMDAFVSLTGMDEENVIVSLLAKKLGVPKVISKISRTNYIPLVETMGIDAAVTPSIISAGEIMKTVLGEKVIALSLILGGKVEVMEFIAHENSGLINVPVQKLNFPKGAIIATIVHGDEIIIPRGNDVIRDSDRVVILSEASEVEFIRNLFKVREGKNSNGLWNSIKNIRNNTTR